MMNLNSNSITRIFKHFVSALVRRRGNFLYNAPLNITFEEELGKQKFNIGIVNWDFFPLVVRTTTIWACPLRHVSVMWYCVVVCSYSHSCRWLRMTFQFDFNARSRLSQVAKKVRLCFGFWLSCGGHEV